MAFLRSQGAFAEGRPYELHTFAWEAEDVHGSRSCKLSKKGVRCDSPGKIKRRNLAPFPAFRLVALAFNIPVPTLQDNLADDGGMQRMQKTFFWIVDVVSRRAQPRCLPQLQGCSRLSTSRIAWTQMACTCWKATRLRMLVQELVHVTLTLHSVPDHCNCHHEGYRGCCACRYHHSSSALWILRASQCRKGCRNFKRMEDIDRLNLNSAFAVYRCEMSRNFHVVVRHSANYSALRYVGAHSPGNEQSD
eukprot:6434269-Amphidinium_carterae.1